MQREERRGPWGRVLSKSGVYGWGGRDPTEELLETEERAELSISRARELRTDRVQNWSRIQVGQIPL